MCFESSNQALVLTVHRQRDQYHHYQNLKAVPCGVCHGPGIFSEFTCVGTAGTERSVSVKTTRSL